MHKYLFFSIKLFFILILNFVNNKSTANKNCIITNNKKCLNNYTRYLSSNNENHKLNNIIKIFHPNDQVNFISSIVNDKGDLFILTNIEGLNTDRIVFAIKKDGEKYFENEEQYYKYITVEEEGFNRYPVLTFIKINNIEYLVAFSQDGPIELFNFQEGKIYSTYNLNTVLTNSVIRKNTFTSLNYYDKSVYALNAFINKKTPYNLYIQKIYFQTYKLSKTTTILVNNTNSEIGNRNSSVTCFEINEYVECLYENSNSIYTVALCDISNLELIYNEEIETNHTTYYYLFSKCIHIKNNIGAFIYYVNNNRSPKLTFKELIFPSSTSTEFQLNDYFSPIIINKDNIYGFGNNYVYNDIIKIDENNIIYISTENESEKLMIVLIRILDNYQNLLICYYELKLKELYNIKIFEDITSFVYIGLLGIGVTHYDYNVDLNKTYSSFFIIGNSSIKEINLDDDNNDIFFEDNIYNFGIENIIINIDNNIFGYAPKGIKLLSEINQMDLCFNLYSTNLQKNIEFNETILINDTINFKRKNNLGIKLGNYTFELLPVISEPNYDDFISYFDLVEYYPNYSKNFRTYFSPKNIYGRKSYLTITVRKCFKTCQKCTSFGNTVNHQCEICSLEYPYYYNNSNENNEYFNCLQKCPDNYYPDVRNLCLKIEKDDINEETDNNEKETDNNFSEKDFVECPKDFPFEILLNHSCSGDCSGNNFFNRICKISYHSIEAKEKLINNIRTEIQEGSLNSMLNNLKNDDLYIIDEFIDIYQITTTYNQKNKDYNISTIDLGECENVLKNQYNISENETLILFKYEFYNEGYYIPITEYEVYHPITKRPLDLYYCKHLQINITIPVSINEDNLFIYNSSSAYYNNICYKFKTKNKTDITLYDRKTEYNNNNLSLCEKKCNYFFYNVTNKKVICQCDVKANFSNYSDITFNISKLIDKFLDLKKHSNIGVIKCFKLLFEKNSFFHNIGNYILLVVVFTHIILSIIFYTKGHKSLLDLVKQIIYVKYQNNNNKIKNKDKDKFQSSDKIIKVDIKRLKSNNLKKKIVKINSIKKNKEKKNNNSKNSNKSIAFINSNFKKNSQKSVFLTNTSEIIHKKKKFHKVNNLMEKVKEKSKANYNEYELNFLTYKLALKYDKRTFFQYYFSLLKINHLLLLSFYPNFDYNSKVIKVSLFFISFSLYFAINTLFFTDATMHRIYIDRGIFNIIYQIPSILYSSLISGIINYMLKYLSLSQKSLLQLKEEKLTKILSSKSSQIIKCLNIKFIIFYVLSFLLLIIFWYYISCFCAVYYNTQILLIEDTLISFALSFIYPIFICIIPSILRFYSLYSEKKEKENIYKISKILQ